MSASTKAAARYPGPSVALLTLWNAVFVVFTALQLVYNKTPLQVSGLPLLSVSDAIEFAVPLAVIPLYWAVWLSCFPEGVRPRFWVHLMPMIAGSALFTHGHGIHLAANSLSNSFVRLFPDKRGTPEATLMSALDLFDEHLSHMLWIGGLCFLEWAIVRVQLRLPSSNALHPARQTPAVWRPMSWVVLVASLALALVYGVLFFCHNIEGGTFLIGGPFCVAMLALVLVRHRRTLRLSPVVVYYCASHVVTLALFATWYHINGGTMPEFSELKNKNFVNSFYANSNSNAEL